MSSGLKILFLDVDGVINSAAYAASDRCRERGGILGIDPAAVPLLNAITDRTGAVIVVSSTWRLTRTDDELRAVLAASGVSGPVLGATPRRLRAPQRGYEIQAWLTLWGEVTRFLQWEPVDPARDVAILDDDSDMAHLAHRLVRTTWARGLEPEHVERVVALLGERKDRS